jgi:two-component system, sensor histidine kinase LadS
MGRRFALPVLMLWCLLPLMAQASDVVLGPRTRSVSVLSFAQVADGRASFADVQAGRVAFVPFGKFKARGRPVQLWIRLTLQSAETHDRRKWMLLVPRTFESADLYRSGEPPLHNGMDIPVRARPLDIFVPGFRLLDRDFSGPPLYLHVAYYSDVPPLITITNEHGFFVWNEPYRVIEGAFVGVLLAVALFNMFVFGIMRDRSALWYVIYILTMFANEVVTTGIGDEFLWPDLAVNSRIGGYFTEIFAFAAFLFFARSFLRTREEARPWDRTLIGAFAVYAIMQVAVAFVPAASSFAAAVLAVQLGAMIVTALAGFSRLRSGYEPARFFVIAFVPFMAGVFANLYYDTFVPPGNWFWATNGVELGTMFQAAILSFSIIDRLRILQSEQHRTRKELSSVSEHALEMRRLALIDPLTGLPNRMQFAEELTSAIERAHYDECKIAVLFVDLDRFKAINDRFGHRFGDEVLRTVAARLAGRLRASDLVARLGGDEFAAILENVGCAEHVEHVAQQIAGLLDDPLIIDGHLMPIGISVGRAIYPDDGQTMDTLLHAADLRMYAMKERVTH